MNNQEKIKLLNELHTHCMSKCNEADKESDKYEKGNGRARYHCGYSDGYYDMARKLMEMILELKGGKL